MYLSGLVTYKKLLLSTLTFMSFVVPFFGDQQLVVGMIVNCLMALSCLSLNKIFWPVLILPSIGTLMRGVVFGPLTIYLLFFLPFIWLSNFVFCSNLHKFHKNAVGALIIASLSKALILYTAASVYTHFNLVPSLFIQTMGLWQLITAFFGGFLGWLIYNNVEKSNHEKLL